MDKSRLDKSIPLEEDHSIRLNTYGDKIPECLVPLDESKPNAACEATGLELLPVSKLLIENNSLNNQGVTDSALITNRDNEGSSRQDLYRVNLFARRVVAVTIDQVIAVFLFGVLAIPASIVCHYCLSQLRGYYNVEFDYALLVPVPVGIFAWTMALIVVPAKLESSRWQATFGKRWLNLMVIDHRGNRIGYWKGVLRLLIQLTLVLVISIITAGGLMQLIGLTMFGRDPEAVIPLGEGASNNLRLSVPILTFVFCNLVSLFTPRGQTLLDLATRRIVEAAPWSWRSLELWENLPTRTGQAVEILFKNEKGKLDYLMAFYAGCTALAVTLLTCILFLHVYAYGEVSRAISESSTAEDLGRNAHYCNARKWFEEPDQVFSLSHELRKYLGDAKGANDDFTKSSILSPDDWAVQTAYGIELESRANYKGALDALEHAFVSRMIGKGSKTKQVWKFPEYHLPSASSQSISANDLCLKLVTLANKFGYYDMSIGYLDDCLKLDDTDGRLYLARSEAYRASGKFKQAESDREKAYNRLSQVRSPERSLSNK